MSHGGYTEALDIWSLGCVFGELIQRVPYLGKSSTPMLQVRGQIWSADAVGAWDGWTWWGGWRRIRKGIRKGAGAHA